MTHAIIEIRDIQSLDGNDESGDFDGVLLEVKDESGVTDGYGNTTRNLYFRLKSWKRRTDEETGVPTSEDDERAYFCMNFEVARELKDFLEYCIHRHVQN